MEVATSRFGNTSHLYVADYPDLEPQPPAPSVTKVIGIKDKPALVGWKGKTTAERAIEYLDMLADHMDAHDFVDDRCPLCAVNGRTKQERARKWLAQSPTRKMELGTLVHELADKVNKGEPFESIQQDAVPFLKTYLRDFLLTYKPEDMLSEFKVYSHEHHYGGTADLLCRIQGEWWLLDIKTGEGLYPEHALQLAALANAEFIGWPGEMRRKRLPDIKHFGIVHVRPEQARLREVPVTDADWRGFLFARGLFNWSQEREGVIGAALSGKGTVAA